MDIIYKILMDKIEKLKKSVEHFVIGKSYLGKDIICFKLSGISNNNIIVQGGMHAREYITSFLVIEQIEFMKDFKLNNNFYDFIEIAHYQIGFEKREIEMKSFKIHGLSYPVKEQGVSTGNANDEIIIDSDMIKNNTLEKSRSK